MSNKAIWGAVALIAVVAFWFERHRGFEPDTSDSPIASAVADVEAPDLKSMLSVTLEDDHFHGNGWQVNIVNVGTGLITIKQFQFNGRADCDTTASDDLPKTLKVGDRAEMNTYCANVVRVHISTDRGDADYTFDPVTNQAN